MRSSLTCESRPPSNSQSRDPLSARPTPRIDPRHVPGPFGARRSQTSSAVRRVANDMWPCSVRRSSGSLRSIYSLARRAHVERQALGTERPAQGRGRGGGRAARSRVWICVASRSCGPRLQGSAPSCPETTAQQIVSRRRCRTLAICRRLVSAARGPRAVRSAGRQLSR